MTEETQPAPVLRHTGRIVAGLRDIAGREEAVLTFAMLIAVMGKGAHRLVLLALTLLNMLPGPPGFSGTICWTTIAVCVAMIRGRPIWVPPILGNRRLPLKLLLRASESVDRVTAMLARFSRPRLRWLTGRAAILPHGIFTIGVSLAMVPPIPLINVVPNIGLCILAFSMLNRDGVGVLAGVFVCFVGLLIEVLLILGAFNLGVAAMNALG